MKNETLLNKRIGRTGLQACRRAACRSPIPCRSPRYLSFSSLRCCKPSPRHATGQRMTLKRLALHWCSLHAHALHVGAILRRRASERILHRVGLRHDEVRVDGLQAAVSDTPRPPFSHVPTTDCAARFRQRQHAGGRTYGEGHVPARRACASTRRRTQ
eukprot:COSAG02_NODE_3619_length_6464_cov_15.210683_5_plen_158_part_00